MNLFSSINDLPPDKSYTNATSEATEYNPGFRWYSCFSYQIECLQVFRFVMWFLLRFPSKNDVRFVFTNTICFVGGSCFANAICIYLCILYGVKCDLYIGVCLCCLWWVSLVEQNYLTFNITRFQPHFCGI